eukprot:532950-Amphidinium_carterae.1
MGRNTAKAQECFSELVALASLPCSLTVFKQTAELIGCDFRTPEAMRGAPLPAQGQTNITEGIEVALDVIRKQHSSDVENAQIAHHVLVLLSDGAHNAGTHPSLRLPGLGASLRSTMPELRLSVVVVGVTSSSDTSMGMLLKQTLETVPLELLEPIYFAASSSQMTEVLQELSAGLAALRGSLVPVTLSKSAAGAFVKQIGEDLSAEMHFIAGGHEYCFLVKSDVCPEVLCIDGDAVLCRQVACEDFDVELAAAALNPLLSALRVKRVAGAQPDATIRAAVEQLNQLVLAVEVACAERKRLQGDEFNLKKTSPQQRVAQHKAATGLLLHVKELRNQVAQIEAFRTSSSAEQAAFLNGKSSKYGGKALLRAAARRENGSSDMLAQLDAQQFLEDLLKDTVAKALPLREALREDMRAKVENLSDDDRSILRDALLSGPSSAQ